MGLRNLLGLRSSENGSARPVGKDVRQLAALCHSLLSERGEVSGARLASEALAAYQSLDPNGRAAFYDLLVRDFSPDPEKVGRAGDAYRAEPTPANLAQLQRAAEPPRQELFRRLNLAAGGTALLVDLRRQVLDAMAEHPEWAPVEADLAHLLRSWFNRGFLELRRIDWRTPAMILEKLIRYEAVHEIRGWPDLRRRLEADRRCYAFFHPALPDEPIIFIEVALTRGMSGKVQPLLDPDAPVCDPAEARFAMFYSITNCQDGLRGVPFGSFLIKRVAEDLALEFPRMRTFATISPVAGFREWMEEAARKTGGPKSDGLAALIVKMDHPAWASDREHAPEVQAQLTALCAYYLVCAKRGKEPLDPIARFHLGNGAELERIHWMGDTSASGIARSAGLMVNYVYRVADVERNHELYTREYRIAASREIEKLAKQSLMSEEKAGRTKR